MRIYLDDDSASELLAQLLRNEGHDVETPRDASAVGAKDAVHLARAIQHGRACLSGNHNDFAVLHHLILVAQGSHPGILIVRRDNDPTRDLSPRGIVRAIRNLLGSSIELRKQFIILNHWR